MVDILRIILNISAGSVLIVCGALLLSVSMEVITKRKASAVYRKINTPFSAFIASALITSLVQSSTAVTVLTVSMANAGALGLTSAMAAVYGANIGTTLTAQIMSLDISHYGILVLVAGTALFIAFRSAGKPLAVPKAIMGLGLLFTGLLVLKSSALIIKHSGYIMGFIDYYSASALWCVLFGFITTALVHSSSATIGLTIALFSGGVIGFRQAVLITLGDNIGTCVTALIAASAGSVAGRRVAWGNMLYNIICALLSLVFFDAFTELVLFITDILKQPEAFLVANSHTLVNIFGAILFLPLNKYVCVFLEFFITERGEAARKGGMA